MRPRRLAPRGARPTASLLLAPASADYATCALVHLDSLGKHARAPLQQLQGELAHYRTLLEHVITQTASRVLHDETMPAAEKLVSLFEPHAVESPRAGEIREPDDLRGAGATGS